jgi:hypothetical protein
MTHLFSLLSQSCVLWLPAHWGADRATGSISGQQALNERSSYRGRVPSSWVERKGAGASVAEMAAVTKPITPAI